MNIVLKWNSKLTKMLGFKKFPLSSNSLVKLMSVFVCLFVQAYIWRCDYPIEMGFAPKDV